mmetsp:Transcript_37819/g.79741  ORF Transcript_37819/g.79741 Transcript_37819/m.79741 type:complete len:124 (-) Transcript_37819:354-725(-)
MHHPPTSNGFGTNGFESMHRHDSNSIQNTTAPVINPPPPMYQMPNPETSPPVVLDAANIAYKYAESLNPGLQSQRRLVISDIIYNGEWTRRRMVISFGVDILIVARLANKNVSPKSSSSIYLI